MAGPFKAYDVRGKVPEVLSETLARNIGRAYAERFELLPAKNPNKVRLKA